ncbi:MAG: methionyl-tRNA formyltransferase [bacterium]|nr:methionyl-tRNA formyltransferase [bacterium]
MKYVYFGTSEFAAIILEELLKNGNAPVAVVTMPDRRAGRGQSLKASPVKTLASMHHIPMHQPEKPDAALLMDMRLYAPDLFVVAAYGKLLPKTVIDFPQYKTLNVHPSLLPLYRGPSPIQTAILNGDKKTGVTIMLLDEQMDHGPLLAKEAIEISPDATAASLLQILAHSSASLLMKTMPRWITHAVKAVPQNDSEATVTKLLAKEDGHIDWMQSAEYIERHVRAMTPWPGSWTRMQDKTLKILRARVLSTSSNHPAGSVLGLKNDLLEIVCGSNILGVSYLQIEGRKPVTAAEFVNGYRGIIGTTLL